MDRYIVEDEGFGRCLWLDTTRTIGDSGDYESVEPYEVAAYVDELEQKVTTLEARVAELEGDVTKLRRHLIEIDNVWAQGFTSRALVLITDYADGARIDLTLAAEKKEE